MQLPFFAKAENALLTLFRDELNMNFYYADEYQKGKKCGQNWR